MMLSIMNERHALLACTVTCVLCMENDKNKKTMRSWHVVLKVIVNEIEIVCVER